MRDFIRQNLKLSLAFAVAVLVTLFFLTRFTLSMIYWSDPAHRDQEIAGWMTLRYVARSWHVPPEYLRQTLEIERSGEGPLTVERLATARGQTLSELSRDLTQAITSFRETRTGGHD